MSEESTTDTYTVSFKSSPGYDASLVVVRGDTPQELEQNIEGIHSILTKVVETENLFHAAYAAQSPGPYNSSGQIMEQQPQQTTGVVRTCAHGPRTRREGTSKKGKWVGHFCALPKEATGKCDPVWEE